MAGTWKNFKLAMKDKRSGKSKLTPSNDILKKEEVVIQRLSSEVSGKAQKCSRVGPREFVPYEYEEMSLKNIKDACKKHFASTIGKTMVCDILAGEQGPSCTSLDQIPDLRVVYLRFIEQGRDDGLGDDGLDDDVGRPKRKCHATGELFAKSLPVTKVPIPSKAFPKSLSVLEMLKLGKVISQKTENIELFTFDINDMAWSSTPVTAEFSIAKEPFGKGGFREAFKARSKTPEFHNRGWVVKKYLNAAIDVIQQTNQTVEQHTKKVVQMHMLTKNFTLKLEEELKKEGNYEFYGESVKYKSIFMGRMKGESEEHEWVTVEEFIE
jgi:hypothetical protein